LNNEHPRSGAQPGEESALSAAPRSPLRAARCEPPIAENVAPDPVLCRERYDEGIPCDLPKVGKTILWRGVDLPVPARVVLTEAERKEFWKLWKDPKLHISEVIVRAEEFIGKIFDRVLGEA
jgi:hypothetical protein